MVHTKEKGVTTNPGNKAVLGRHQKTNVQSDQCLKKDTAYDQDYCKLSINVSNDETG